MEPRQHRHARGWSVLLFFFVGGAAYLFIERIVQPRLHLAGGWKLLAGSLLCTPVVLFSIFVLGRSQMK